MSFYNRLVVTFLVFIITPVVLVSSAIFYYSQNITEKEILAKLDAIADRAQAAVEGVFSDIASDALVIGRRYIYKTTFFVLDQFSADTSNPAYDGAKKEIDLRLSMLQRSHRYADITLANAQGRILYVFDPKHESEVGTFIPDKDRIFEDTKNGIYFKDAQITAGQEDPYGLSLAGRIYGDGDKVIGFVLIGLDLRAVNKILQDNPIPGKSFEILLVKKIPGNKVMFLSPLKYDLTKPITTHGQTVSPAARAALGENGSGPGTDYRGKKVLSAWRPIHFTGWGLETKIDAAEALGAIKKLRTLLLGVILLTIVFVVLAALKIAKSIADPIQRLRQGMEIIGAGNLDYKVGTDATDEVGQLARAFDIMTGNLKRSTVSIGDLNKEIAEHKKAQEELDKKTLELNVSLKDALTSRAILTSMLDDNSIVRERIAQSEKIFRSIFEEAADGILIVDTQTNKFFMSNKAICRMLGYSREEILDFGVLDIYLGKDPPCFIDQSQKKLQGRTGARLLSSNLPIKRKDGSIFYADVSSTMVDIAGKAYAMGFFHDLSERREVEDLRRIDKIKKDFIANMSHELRTPLNAIIGFGEVLAGQKFGPLNKEQSDFLNDILESSKFLLSLINDILDLAKIESGKMRLSVSDFSLRDLLEHSLIFVKERAFQHQIELSLEIAQEVGYARADERKIRQIIFNLLSNAVKFTPDGGKVGIKARIDRSEAEVTVWDTGIGISQEDQDKLFMPFMQLEPSLSKEYEGTGLGLSLARELVELHQGRIWVESEGKGKGSSFKFSLPIAKESSSRSIPVASLGRPERF